MIMVVQLSYKVGLFTCKQGAGVLVFPRENSYSSPKNAFLAAAQQIIA